MTIRANTKSHILVFNGSPVIAKGAEGKNNSEKKKTNTLQIANEQRNTKRNRTTVRPPDEGVTPTNEESRSGTLS